MLCPHPKKKNTRMARAQDVESFQIRSTFPICTDTGHRFEMTVFFLGGGKSHFPFQTHGKDANANGRGK